MNQYWKMDPISAIPLMLSALSGFVCMLLSTTFHLFCCTSNQLNRNQILYNSLKDRFFGNRFFEFWICKPNHSIWIQLWSNFKMDLLRLSCVYKFYCILCIFLIKFMMTKYLNDPKNALKKCILFALMGIFTAAPVFHLITLQ